MIEWLLGSIVQYIIGGTLFIAVVAAAAAGAGILLGLRGMKTLAWACWGAGGLVCAFLVGLQISGSYCDARVQAIRDELQAAENAERARQDEINELRRSLGETNAKASLAAANDREGVIREIRTKIVPGDCRGWTDAEFGRLLELTRSRRQRGGN